jgi:hypothetical protein
MTNIAASSAMSKLSHRRGRTASLSPDNLNKM